MLLTLYLKVTILYCALKILLRGDRFHVKCPYNFLKTCMTKKHYKQRKKNENLGIIRNTHHEDIIFLKHS